ncbi:MAG TPA: DNA polymerase III subunit beta, partial [Planctomycetales bacterium]|nr:DNA polymerase III subunit beta [Planctomycetales bacterium]
MSGRTNMRARCRREGLLSACQLASAALPAREVKPILRNLKAVAADGRCTLMATDLEVGIRLDVQGLAIEEPGEAILPAARLIAILREAHDEELTIEADQTACIVRGPTLEFEMPGEDPAQFPEWPTFTEEKYHEISAGSLREMIRRTLFAVADETGRYSMTGVLWDLDGETTRLVGSDGYRLALAQGTATSHGGHTTKGQNPVVPTKAMSLLERNLQDDPEETVKICIRPNDVLFRT